MATVAPLTFAWSFSIMGFTKTAPATKEYTAMPMVGTWKSEVIKVEQLAKHVWAHEMKRRKFGLTGACETCEFAKTLGVEGKQPDESEETGKKRSHHKKITTQRHQPKP
jgi:hypothetical protein